MKRGNLIPAGLRARVLSDESFNDRNLATATPCTALESARSVVVRKRQEMPGFGMTVNPDPRHIEMPMAEE